VDFSAHDISLVIGDAPRRVIIAADALQFWWGADVGPQTPEGLVADHMIEVQALAVAKLASGAIEPDGSIAITDDDLE
jgi:hypothetical protein